MKATKKSLGVISVIVFLMAISTMIVFGAEGLPEDLPGGTLFTTRYTTSTEFATYWMTPDGNHDGLFFESVQNVQPVEISPDGERAVMQLSYPFMGDLYLVDIDGESNLVSLDPYGGAPRWSPNWSPDGKEITFVLSWNVYVQNVDENSPQYLSTRRLLGFDGEVRQTTYAPNGDIYFMSYGFQANNHEIYRIDAETHAVQRITYSPNFAENDISVSPDGKYLVYGKRPFPFQSVEVIELYLYDIENQRELDQPLVSNGRWNRYAVWSPDSQYIIFSSKPDDEDDSELYYVNVNGGPEYRLTYNDYAEMVTDWAPVSMVENVPPEVILPVEEVTLVEGEFLEVTGTFLDPGEGQIWTGQVDYDLGDGFEEISVDQVNLSFMLYRQYDLPQEEPYEVTVVIEDGESSGEAFLNVTVLSHQEAAENGMNLVNDWIDSGEISGGHGQELVSKLDAIVRALENENAQSDAKKLEILIANIERLVKNGELSQENGDELISILTRILDTL